MHGRTWTWRMMAEQKGGAVVEIMAIYAQAPRLVWMFKTTCEATNVVLGPRLACQVHGRGNIVVATDASGGIA